MNVKVQVNTKLEEVSKEHVIVSNVEGECQEVEVDQVVYAVGFRSNDGLQQKLEMKVKEVYGVGDDGSKIGQIYDATGDDYVVGKSI